MNKYASIIEEGVIAGNLYDKYGTKNPIARHLMRGFIDSVNDLVSITSASDIHEIGCGEGHLGVILAKEDIRVRVSDFSHQVIDKAQGIAKSIGANIHFKVASIYDLKPHEDAAELVVCCEVLEHLEDPRRAMNILSRLAKPYLIVSVPREPVWRILTILRGKYIRSLGNTPGHIQHWSKTSFLHMLGKYVDIVKVLTPLPWIMVLCRERK
jgi:2-polyprenyl-3-methyl-5-hydroxy-6-metoxy-1,4-benzoquinol methylase